MVSSVQLGQASLQEATLASAATTDLGSVANWKVSISGTNAITSFGTRAHAFRALYFSGSLTLTHNATSLILPGAANIATAAADTCLATSDGSGNWRVRAYQRASGKPTVGVASADITDATTIGKALLTAASAAAARGAAALNIDGVTTHGDSAYAILATDRTVSTSAALTAARTWTLPAASAVNAGQELVVEDAFGGVTAANPLTIARAGSDTIDGVATSHVLASARAYLRLRSDGVSNWKTLGRTPNLVVFTTSGTYTPSPAMMHCSVLALGAGGGGGGGALQAASTACSGAGGGAGGAASPPTLFAAVQIGASQTVTIGAGGAAGLAATVNSTAGGNGGQGGNTTLGTLLKGGGGGGGAGGQLAAAAGGGGGGGPVGQGSTATGSTGASGSYPGQAGQPATTTNQLAPIGGAGGGQGFSGGAGNTGWASAWAGVGGGAGGGISAANAALNGGAGGASYFGAVSGIASGGVAGGTVAGGAGIAPASSQPVGCPGSAGAGGASAITGTAGAGGAGALGSGGGGGGSMTNGGTPGAGGLGGAGCLWILEIF